jgi:hypothetical protein
VWKVTNSTTKVSIYNKQKGTIHFYNKEEEEEQEKGIIHL